MTVAPSDVERPDVLEAARRRFAKVFDAFPRVVVSVSGGKDSTVIRHLAAEEAARRGRRIEVFFLDQEAEYQSTIDVISAWVREPHTDPSWYQVPLRLTNATSHADYWLRAWEPGAEWVRAKDPLAVWEAEGAPDRFYDFFEWRERTAVPGTAFVVGLRAMESMNRHRATTRRAGFRDWTWSTKTKGPDVFRVYPIYDWTVGDVWRYISDQGLAYNLYYDRAFAKIGHNLRALRVSNLVHEQAFRCLGDLQEFEPETYDRLVRRLGGVHAAALYGQDGRGIYSANERPVHHESWRAYRDYLLATTPCDRVERFRRRFAGQGDDEATCRGQVRQLLTNDWENNVPVPNLRLARLREVWWPRL